MQHRWVVGVAEGQVPDVDGLRPSGDRVRETLFNWLMPALPGARVLDMFAGSGALGIEAVSRGAAAAAAVARPMPLAAPVISTLRPRSDGTGTSITNRSLNPM